MPQEVEQGLKQWDYNEKLAMFMFQVGALPLPLPWACSSRASLDLTPFALDLLLPAMFMLC